MLIRISLIVAIVAGLAVAVVNFVQVKEVITTTRDTLSTTSNTLVQTQTTLSKTQRDLKSTQSELATTKETLKTTEEVRDQALADAETNRKRSAELTTKLNTTTKERDDAQAELAAWNALGIQVNQVKTLIANYKEAQEAIEVAKQENRILSNKNRSLQAKVDFLLGGEDYHVKLPEELKGKITSVDPKWDFVVLNIGEDQGVLQDGELLINRSGKLVAKVRVTMVQKDRCIANLVPGWKLGDVIEGDSAIPAFF
jgi:hypothetical protein